MKLVRIPVPYTITLIHGYSVTILLNVLQFRENMVEIIIEKKSNKKFR
jgi:hypothetical protein